MRSAFTKLDLFTQVKDTAQETKKLCGTILGFLWILFFIAYSIFTIATYDVSTPIVSIQDRDVTTMPGNLSLDSMNISISLLCMASASVPSYTDCTSTPGIYTMIYNNNDQSLTKFNSFQTVIYQTSGTGGNYSYPFSVDLSQLDLSLTFATFHFLSQVSSSSIEAIYLQINLTNLQIDYTTGDVNVVSSVYYEQMDANYKMYFYEFQIQDYYINSKSQFSNHQSYYRKITMQKIFDSIDSTSDVTWKFMVNPLVK